MRNISFILILLLKFVYDNFQGLFVFVSLFSIFYHVNKETGSRIAFHTNLSIKRVFLTSFSIAGCIFFILFVSGYEQHHGTLIFLPPTYEKITLWQLFWIISMSDLLIKFVTVSIKIYIACLLRHVMTFSGRVGFYSQKNDLFIFRMI